MTSLMTSHEGKEGTAEHRDGLERYNERVVCFFSGTRACVELDETMDQGANDAHRVTAQGICPVRRYQCSLGICWLDRSNVEVSINLSFAPGLPSRFESATPLLCFSLLSSYTYPGLLWFHALTRFLHMSLPESPSLTGYQALALLCLP